MLTEDDDIGVSEEWFETDYIEGVKTAKHWLKSLNTSASVRSERDQPVGSQAELLALMSMPKEEIDKFSGDPLEYQTFVMVFDEVIDARIDDPQVKLNRLLQYTTGSIKAAIKNCALVGGCIGYAQAREILQDRYGDVHLVSQRVISDQSDKKWQACIKGTRVTAAIR